MQFVYVRELRRGDQGPDVKNLLDALFLLLRRAGPSGPFASQAVPRDRLRALSQGLADERTQNIFGDATEQLVALLQPELPFGDRNRGIVDETTAAALNGFLAKEAAPSQQTPQSAAPKPTETAASAKGGIQRHMTRSTTEPATTTSVTPPLEFVVTGSVLRRSRANPAGAPAEGVTVQLFDQDVAEATPLGEAKTGADGRYRISFTESQFLAGDGGTAATVRSAALQALITAAAKQIKPTKNAPDLWAGVPRNGGGFLVKSDIIFNAGTKTEIDLILPAETAISTQGSELEQVSVLVLPRLRGLTLDGLTEDQANFLSKDTEMPLAPIRALILAAKLANQTAPPTSEKTTKGPLSSAASDDLLIPLYGLLRTRAEQTLADILGVGPDIWRKALLAAFDKTILPKSLASSLDSWIGKLSDLRITRALEPAAAQGLAATLGDLLDALPTSAAIGEASKRTAVAQLWTTSGAKDDAFWTKISAVGLSDLQVGALKTTMALNDLAGGNVALARALRDKLPTDDGAGATLAPLAELRPDEWIDLAYTHGTPVGTTVGPVAYADALATQVERDHPAASLAVHIETRRLGQQAGLGEVSTFLRKNPGFDIRMANLRAPNLELNLDGVKDRTQLVDGLRGLQRMNRLGARWDETAALLENGVASPHRVLMVGPTQLGALLDGQVPEERISQLYNAAREMFGTTFCGFTAALSPLHAPQPMADEFTPAVNVSYDRSVVPRFEPQVEADGGGMVVVQAPPEIKVIIDKEPTLQALFGPQDTCACEDCQSVLSPSAYFVDVLQFLKDASRLQELLARRPDLQDLELSCNNTNTPVPAIDLALEILENAVALPLDVALPPGVDADTELSAHPVGTSVGEALASTVRYIEGELKATPLPPTSRGTTDWAIVDGHRRWTLTVQRKVLRAVTSAGRELTLDTGGLDIATQIVTALNGGQIHAGAEAAFAALLAGNQSTPPDLTNYEFAIDPIVADHNWQLTYRCVARLVLDTPGRIQLQTPAGASWWNKPYNQATIAAVKQEANSNDQSGLLAKLLGNRFPGTKRFTFTAAGVNRWDVKSADRTLMLWFSPAGLTIASLAYQSGDTSVDAIAWPENHNPAAYGKLKGDDATFPWTLPVDLPCEEVREFLKRARTTRQKLMELMAPITATTDDDATVREVLGLTEAEAKLIAPTATPGAPDTLAHWGLAADQTRIWDAATGKDYVAGDALSLLKNVSILLQQSRLSFEDLEAVIATGYVHPAGSPSLDIIPRGSCVPSEMRINAMEAEALERIHRFVRLQRRLGWSIADVDTAIGTIANNVLDTPGLRALATFARLVETVNLLPTTVLAWFATTPAPQRDLELAKALKVTTVELANAAALFGLGGAFDSVAETLRLCARVTTIKARGVTFEDLRYLLRGDPAPASDVELSEAARVALADAARNAARSTPGVIGAAAPLDPTTDPGSKAADAVVAVLADRLQTTRDLVDDLVRVRIKHPTDAGKAAITAFLDSGFVDPNTAPPLVAALETVLVRLYKAVAICTGFGLATVDLRLLRATFLPTEPMGLTALDFNALPTPAEPTPAPVKGLEQLLAVLEVRDLAQGTAALLRQYVALDFTDAAYVGNISSLLGAGLSTGMPTADAVQVRAAANQLQITTADQYRDPFVLLRLMKLLLELKGLGATVALAQGFIASSPTDDQALPARDLLQLKYSDSSWRDLVKPIADALRKRQRDALVDYLMARDYKRDNTPPSNPLLPLLKPLRDENDLYERYLIDVETGTCLTTTRLLAATGAAQLFVQRCLLNLEGPTPFSDDKRELWSWMERYRVWEANRKVFLFPENWLLPELRDDKTAIFRAMEGTLADQEPSLESTRGALVGYLDELGEQAQITTVGMYADRPTITGDDGKDHEDCTLYIVGRTPNQPYKYFWRSCAHFGDPATMYWSGWEAVDLDNGNDYLMPFVFEGDLYIAWPTFKSTTDDAIKDVTKNLRWEVQLAWTRRTARGWTKRKFSNDVLTTQRLVNKVPENSFTFRLGKTISVGALNAVSAEAIDVTCYAADETGDADAGPYQEKADLVPFGPAVGGFNATVSVVCIVKAKFTLSGATIYEDLTDVSLKLRYLAYPHGIQARDPQTHTTRQEPSYTPAQVGGAIVIEVADTGGAGEGPAGLQEGQIEATFSRSGSPDRKLGPVLLDTAHVNFTLTYTVVFEVLESPSGRFAANRLVDYQRAGLFRIDALHDVSVSQEANGPKLPLMFAAVGQPVASTSIVSGNGFQFKTLLPALPLPANATTTIDRGTLTHPTITPSAPFDSTADLSAFPAGPLVLYIQDDTRRFFLDLRAGAATAWPDGQAFVGLYRWLTVGSTFAIFGPPVERTLLDNQDSTRPPGVLRTVDSAISFARNDTYANYNWELFLHLPLTIADYLAKQQRFEDARRWLHAVFDPTAPLDSSLVPQFWKVLPFDNATQPAAIANLLTWLIHPDHNDPDLQSALQAQIKEWKANPFMPHLIARMRPSAYQWWTFFAYIELLIGWGDQLFRQDTRESVNEATLLYILAAKMLGPRPRTIPVDPSKPTETYRTLPKDADGNLAQFSEAWVTWTDQPGMTMMLPALAAPSGLGVSASQASQLHPPFGHLTLASLSALAFCIPRNTKIDELHDRVDLRLYRIRNCMNIDGVTRALPYYDPPIDPLLLIRAKAAGLDLSGLPSASTPPLPHYRFTTMLQRANELAAEVKALGAALLAALEKKDGEDLGLLRSRHEIAVLKLVRETRQRQIDEADAAIVALQQSRETTQQRLVQFQSLLGQTSVANGQDGLPIVAQSSMLSIAKNVAGDASGLGLTLKEVDQLNLSNEANTAAAEAGMVNVIAGILSALPNNSFSAGAYSISFGGSNLGSAATAAAKAIEMSSAGKSFEANRHSTLGGYERRQDDWVYQSKLAVAELKQIDKQILAANIRKDIAQKELNSHEMQMDNAKEVDDFLRSKFTNRELHRWMSSSLSEVYFRSYQLAVDLAQRAERAFRHELGRTEMDPIITPTHWDNLKQGLLAGEQLSHDLKRLEAAYFDQNERELEIAKHVSVAQLDPLALIKLKEKGTCTIFIPEVLFDLDYPGHYFRRLKSVAISIPCVAGPYANVSCTLTLNQHSYRKSKAAADEAAYRSSDPFADQNAFFFENGTNAIRQVIVTSSAQNDSGMFETNLRDERYLPFEGLGAISQWSIELPEQFRPFDYETISDIILHLRFTARDGGASLKETVTDSLTAALNAITDSVEKQSPLVRVFSVRHEFPSEWYRLLNPPTDATGDARTTITLSRDRFPAMFRDARVDLSFDSFEILVAPKPEFLAAHTPAETKQSLKLSFRAGPNPSGTAVDLDSWQQIPGLYAGPVAGGGLPGKWTLAAWWQKADETHIRLQPDALQNVLLICRYTITAS
jgi:hypothetical protein